MAKEKKFQNFIRVVTLNSEIEAEMMRGALETSNIPAFVQEVTYKESSYPVDTAEEYSVLVPEEFKEAAEETIASAMEKGQDN